MKSLEAASPPEQVKSSTDKMSTTVLGTEPTALHTKGRNNTIGRNSHHQIRYGGDGGGGGKGDVEIVRPGI